MILSYRFALFGIFLIGAVTGAFLVWAIGGRYVPPQALRLTGNQYPLINPLLICDISDFKPSPELAKLHDKIKKEIQDALAAQRAEKIAVYYRRFSDGRWTGVNENESFSPASLYKVPIMIAVLKQAETDLELLERKTDALTVRKLIEKMIVDSDNAAKDALVHILDPQIANSVFADLGIPTPENPLSKYGISPRQYALFFRILYNATFLRQDTSQTGLEFLAKTTFSDGIAAGIERNILVAHKFGIHKDSNVVELHDCGIVYAESNPYFLCVMTRGKNEKQLAQAIADISRVVFQTQ